MKPLTPKQMSGQFGKKLDVLVKAIDRAALWLESARETSPRLNMEADRLGIKLCRQRNKAAYLAAAAGKECAIGLFGLSQAGKSYLINALAVSEKGRLEIALGAETLDYSALNPQQLTGTMVTRFTGQQVRVDNEWPVQLSLLSEEALIAVIAEMGANRNGEATPDEQQIGDRLKNVGMYRQPQAVDGLTRHDVVALWDRLSASQTASSKALETHFWPLAVDLAPSLSVDDRARLFSLLWHDDRALTALYRQLAHILAVCAPRVLAPLSTLDDPTLSILNVSGLRYFNAAIDRVIQVLPQVEGRNLKPVNVALSELALLSREVTLPYYSAPRETMFEQVDLLDYPGIETPSVVPDDAQHEMALAFLTAKRSFLLTYAAERQDVNLLMVCSAVSQRSDSRIVGRVLDNWVKQTQGENSQVRGRRKPGLIWALTPFDQRITHGQNYDAAVQRYVGNPGDAWGSMLAMDDKGFRRMAGWLMTEVRREIKMERLDEQREELRRELNDNLLGRWYLVSEREEPEARQRVAETLLKALQVRTGVHGELLERLLPDRETLRHLFLQRQRPGERPQEHVLSEDDPFGIGMSIDLLSDEPVPALLNPEVATDEPEAEFAHQVYRLWVNILRQLPDRAPLLELLGVSRATLEMLTEEMVTASIRLDIEGALVN
ncbi:virulence factor SrfC family protein, partial [Erwinia oleae]|uniref:virulence factor SrfC family protein n=1 Tax=Erwinia oleae TaxID=796334 RepID=UPI00055929A9